MYNHDTDDPDEEVHRRALGATLSAIQPYRINRDDIQVFGDLLSMGGFGTVRRAFLRGRPNPEVVVKALTPRIGDVPQTMQHTQFRYENEMKPTNLLPYSNEWRVTRPALRFAREASVWMDLDHPNILRFYGFHLDLHESEFWFISPYLSNGNIPEYRRDREIGFDQIIAWARISVLDVTRGLVYLHSKVPSVVHGDLKGNNILLTDSLDAVLCDFGLAIQYEESGITSGLTTSLGFKGTLRWSSPELLSGEPRSPASDIWAWACVVLELVTGQIPFAALKHDREVYLKVLSGEFLQSDWPSFHLDWIIWPHLTRCFDLRAPVRPAASECLEAAEGFESSFREQSIYDLSSASNISGRGLEQPARDQPQSYETEEAKDKLIEISASLSQRQIEPSCLKIADFPFTRGGYSLVFSASFTATNAVEPIVVVIKILAGAENKSSVRLATSFMREVMIWQRLEHTNILPFFGFHLDPEAPAGLTTYIVSPRLQHGSISAYLRKNNVDAGRRLDWVRGLTNGLVYLHCSQPSIIHGDLKAASDNILVNDSFTPVLCDFGLAVSPEHESHDGLQTENRWKCSLRWCSPELYEKLEDRNEASDTWAWACVVLEIMTQRLPFHHVNEIGVMKRITAGQGPRPEEYPEFPLHQLIWPFLAKCFQMEPILRPDSAHCLDVIENWRV